MGGGFGRRNPDRPIPSALPLHAVARGVRFHRWGLGFKQSSLGHITRALHSIGFGVFVPTCASPPCSCSVKLSPSGKTDGPEVSLLTSPACGRDLTRRFHGAHFPALSIATGPKKETIKDGLMPALKVWHDRLPEFFKQMFTVGTDTIVRTDAPALSAMLLRTAAKNNPDGQGPSSPSHVGRPLWCMGFLIDASPVHPGCFIRSFS